MGTHPDNHRHPIRSGHQPDEMGLVEDPGTAGLLWWRGDPEEARKRLLPVRANRSDPMPVIPGDEGSHSQREAEAPEPCLREQAPAWARRRYRPKTLTGAGVAAIEQMGPDGDGFKGFSGSPVTSMLAHRDLLAGRYAAWDLVARGQVKEVGGVYYHFTKAPSPDLRLLRTRLNVPISDFYLDPVDQMIWLALSRLMTLDQFISLDPANARSNLEMLLNLRDEHLVSSLRVPMGRGSLEVWQLTDKGWRWIRTKFMDMASRGYGPRRRVSPFEDDIITTCKTGRHALHALLQADALQWFSRELISQGHRIRGIFLERALMQEAMAAEDRRFLDFRMAYEKTNWAWGSFDVEIIGTGHSYRQKERMAYLRSSPVFRTFSGASSHIELGWHVCIGR